MQVYLCLQILKSAKGSAGLAKTIFFIKVEFCCSQCYSEAESLPEIHIYGAQILINARVLSARLN